jgi:hypothetical protein
MAAAAAYPDIPALVISGELDSITTPADGAAVAAAFPRGMQVRIANSFHVNALPHARSNCAAAIVRRFIRTLRVDDTSCAAGVPPVRLVARFARQSAELEAAVSLEGNAAAPPELDVAAAAVLTAGDVLARALETSSGHGVGLRGGTFRVRRAGARIVVALDGVRWVEDVAVSGTLDCGRGPGGLVRAALRVTRAAGVAGRLLATWPVDAAPAMARIEGSFGAVQVRAQVPAP